jgi:hypothetical protein
MLSLVSSIFSFFAKILPLVFAFKAGRDNAKKKELEVAVDNAKERNKIENEVNKLSDDDVSKQLRKRWRRGGIL